MNFGKRLEENEANNSIVKVKVFYLIQKLYD
jgi:hypothetical protein